MVAPVEDEETQKLLHHTLIFQTFVFMQLFNWINARKLGPELNAFKHICNNYIFFLVLIITLIVQILLVEFGGKALQTQSLSVKQNMFCILFGLIELPWALIIKQIPIRFFQRKRQQWIILWRKLKISNIIIQYISQKLKSKNASFSI